MTDSIFAYVVAIIGKGGKLITDLSGLDGEDFSPVEIVISAGKDHGVVDDMRFVVYAEGEELFDPQSNASLGAFEVVKGKGRAVHVQDRQSRIRSASTQRVLKNPFRGIGSTFGGAEPQTTASDYKVVAVPFKGIRIGDIVRPI